MATPSCSERSQGARAGRRQHCSRHIVGDEYSSPCVRMSWGRGGTFRSAAILFPVAKRVNADSHGLRKLDLRQAHEAPQGGDVPATLETSLQQATRTRAGVAPSKSLPVSSCLSSVIVVLRGMLVHPLLAARRPPGADDPDGVLVSLCPDDHDHTPPEEADRNEPVFQVGVRRVEDL